MRGGSNLSIFWDLDSCPVHRSISGYEIAEKIRGLSQKLGIVRSFRGYADLTELGAGSLQLRSELQSSGVSLIDCPAMDRKSISSKTMIVDMLTHATDNPPPATLLVIAGNNDFSYAISILRLRCYEVILVSPKDHVGRYSQASLYLDWFNDILGYIPNTAVGDSSHIPRDARRSRSNTSAATPVPYEVLPSQDRPAPSPAGPDPLLLSSNPPRSSPFHQSQCVGLGLHATNINQQNPNGNFPSVEPVPPKAPGPFEAKNKKEMEGKYIDTMSPIMHPMPTLDVQRPSSAPPSYSSFSPAPSLTSQDMCAPISLRSFDISRYTDQSLSDLMDGEMDALHRPIPRPLSPADTSTSTIIPGNPIRGLNINSDISPSFRSTSHSLVLDEFPQATNALRSDTPLFSSISLGQTPPPPAPMPENLTVTTPRPTVLVFETTSTQSPKPPSTTIGQTPKSRPSSSTIFHPPAPEYVPDYFKPLVKKLQEYRTQGQEQPFRPGVAAEIVSSHKEEMETTGASSFMEYAELAEREGIVELSPPGGRPWIALRPEFHEYILE